MLLWMVNLFVVLLIGLGGVAFFTLMERKVLSLSQLRLGPNKVLFLGILQPLVDGIKLLLKSMLLPFVMQSLVYCGAAFSLLCFFLAIWSLIVTWGLLFSVTSCILFLAVLGVGTYLVMLSGWSPVSAFSKLGSMRSMLQGLSFEVSLVLVFLCMCLAYFSFSLLKLSFLLELDLVWLSLWTILMLMDTNRAPFDLLEGESELISGFNLEMGSLLFVYIFLSEYGMILCLSLLGSWGAVNNFLLSPLLMLLVLLIRSCYPRLRYDYVSGFLWQSVLMMGLMLWIINMFLS